MATFWERAARSVYRMLFIVILVISHFGFEGGTLYFCIICTGLFVCCISLLLHFGVISVFLFSYRHLNEMGANVHLVLIFVDIIIY